MIKHHSFFQGHTASRGLTSLELIVVLAIFAILSSITIFNYSAFSNGVHLQNTTQEVALRIQQSQTEAISGRYPHFADPSQYIYAGWKPAYGTYFSTGAPHRFAYFFDQNDENATNSVVYDGLMTGYPANSSVADAVLTDPPQVACGTGNNECLDVVTIQTGEAIIGLCIDDITVPGSCHDNLSIVFQRPFPAARLIVDGGAGSQPQERVTILVLGKNGSGLRGIVVTRLGQIYTRTFSQAEAQNITLTSQTLAQSGLVDAINTFFGTTPGGCQFSQC
jgi:prepilin-type N-terminal cleavage/methylation domain-containing protein